MKKASVSTVLGSAKIIESSGKAYMLLPMGTQLEIIDVLYILTSLN